MNRAALMENITAYNPANSAYLDKLQAAGMSNEQAYAVIERTVSSQSYMVATNEFFLYSAVLFFVLMGVVWLTKPRKGTGGAMGH
jgi:DHA2 family multidrug resistance protein